MNITSTPIPTAEPTLSFKARNITGTHTYDVRNFEPDLTVTELVRGLVERMGLRQTDAGGNPHAWHAFLAREGRHLRGAERAGDALEDQDELIIQPDIQAG